MAELIDPALRRRQYQELDQARALGEQQLGLGPLREQALRQQMNTGQMELGMRMLGEQRQERAQQALQQYQQGRIAQAGQPRLKPGERLTTEGNIEQIPGSSEYLKQANLHAKDYQGLLTAEDTSKSASDKIDWILDKNREADFNSNFGGYNALATQYLPGAQDMRQRLFSLKNQMMKAGLDLMRQGGGVGQMTEKEWPIMRDMIQSLSPTLDEQTARDTLKEINARFEKIASNTKAVYQSEWSGTQYFRNKKAPINPSQPVESRDPTALPPKNAKGWLLHTDAQGRKAYVSPDGKSFEEAS
jgi:hypothetical protein